MSSATTQDQVSNCLSPSTVATTVIADSIQVNLANEFPSPEPTAPADLSLTNELAAQALAQALPLNEISSVPHGTAVQNDDIHTGSSYQSYPSRNGQNLYTVQSTSLNINNQHSQSLSNAEQLTILREHYAKNPNPSKKEIMHLAQRTGRPYVRIREYFRQRRNKLRGIGDIEDMIEPGRASAW
jgi:hypothetical protein